MRKTLCMIALAMGTAGPVWSQQNTQDADVLRPYFTPASSSASTPDDEGFIRRWLLLEPIENGVRTNILFTDSYLREAFGTAHYPEQFTAFPHDGQCVEVAKKTLRWHALDSQLFNVKLFRFATRLEQPMYGVLFLTATLIDCPEDLKDVRLSVGSNSASMWWIDGEEVLLLSGDRRMVKDDATSARLTLAKGRHTLRGAVINGPGMSDFCVRFVDEKGMPISLFTTSVE